MCVCSSLSLSYLLKEVIYGLPVAHLSSQYLCWTLGVLFNECYFITCTVVPNSLPYNLAGDLRTGERQIEEDNSRSWQDKTKKAKILTHCSELFAILRYGYLYFWNFHILFWTIVDAR